MSTGGNELKILLIEEDPTWIQTVQSCVRSLCGNATVVLAANTDEALQLLTKDQFIVAISELKGKKIDGLRMLREMSKMAHQDRPKQLIIYSELIDSDAPPSEEHVLFLSKPVEIPRILDCLRPHLPASEVSKVTISTPKTVSPRIDGAMFDLFARGVSEFFSKMLESDIGRDRMFLRKEEVLSGEIAGIQPLKSRLFVGQLVVVMSQACLDGIGARLFKETQIPEARFPSDLMAEMCNQVFGFAKIALNDRGYGFELAIPRQVSGHECNFGRPKPGEIMVSTRYLSEFGEFTMEVQILKTLDLA